MRWIMAVLASALTAFLIMPIHYRWIGHVNHNWMLITKVLPTLICAVFAGTALVRGGGERYAWLIFIGLCICAAADVMLGIHFVTGGALFLLGHLFYMAAFCTQQRPNKWSFLIFAAALALLWLFVWHFKPRIHHPLMFAGVLLYAAALAVVLSLSLPMPFRHFSARTLLAALGAVIFVLSDMGVCHGMLYRIPQKLDYAYLGIYYLAQLLLGLSAF